MVLEIGSGSLSMRSFGGVAPPGRNPVQRPHDTGGGQARIHLHGQAFPVKIVQDVERPEAVTAHQRVMHEINRPTLIGVWWRHQRFWFAGRQALFALAPQVELQGAVHAMHTLVVPEKPSSSQQLKQLAEAVPGETYRPAQSAPL